MIEPNKFMSEIKMSEIEERQNSYALDTENEEESCECPLSEDELLSLIESDDYEPGLARVCGEMLPLDEIDKAIHAWIHRLSEHYEDESAQEAVFDAMTDLYLKGHLGEPPLTDGDLNEKQEWISVFNQLIDGKLRNMGLEF
jgi:hypothetical protein